MRDKAIPLEQALQGEADALVAVFSAFEPRLLR